MMPRIRFVLLSVSSFLFPSGVLKRLIEWMSIAAISRGAMEPPTQASPPSSRPPHEMVLQPLGQDSGHAPNFNVATLQPYNG